MLAFATLGKTEITEKATKKTASRFDKTAINNDSME